ncbi:beta-galactosidase small subunit [Lachnospiraceae bacterium OttesenSCG-928-E19]|nr:beta-galactosidase small subunit [Lachnospiraceae bacterium OttesenSCG-928-E19]
MENTLKLIFGDANLGVAGADFHYIFSYARGGLESYVVKGAEWMYRVPRPCFWRATTDNDRGCGFSTKSSMWMGADMFSYCEDFKVRVDGQDIVKPAAPENNKYTGAETAQELEITFIFRTTTVPTTTVDITYRIEAGGDITIHTYYHGVKGLPQLPVFGIRFTLCHLAKKFRYEGLSGETYPDRKAGGDKGVFEVKGQPVTPYIVPQDCNVHMDTSWVKLYGVAHSTFSITAANQPFAFSSIPYTALELESATHQEELPLPRRTILSVLGKVRGVGGINSWGADVEGAYHISAEEDIQHSFKLVKNEWL